MVLTGLISAPSVTGWRGTSDTTTSMSRTPRTPHYRTVLSGAVTDATSGAPLAGAQIDVDGLTLNALSNT